jgi:hypothetical protein
MTKNNAKSNENNLEINDDSTNEDVKTLENDL